MVPTARMVADLRSAPQVDPRLPKVVFAFFVYVLKLLLCWMLVVQFCLPFVVAVFVKLLSSVKVLKEIFQPPDIAQFHWLCCCEIEKYPLHSGFLLQSLA